jgi:hypothetical protein
MDFYSILFVVKTTVIILIKGFICPIILTYIIYFILSTILEKLSILNKTESENGVDHDLSELFFKELSIEINYLFLAIFSLIMSCIILYKLGFFHPIISQPVEETIIDITIFK